MDSILGNVAVSVDYSGELSAIKDELSNIKKQIDKSYLNDKDLFIKECTLRLYCNCEFDRNEKSQRMIMNDCIKRAKSLAVELFDRKK